MNSERVVKLVEKWLADPTSVSRSEVESAWDGIMARIHTFYLHKNPKYRAAAKAISYIHNSDVYVAADKELAKLSVDEYYKVIKEWV